MRRACKRALALVAVPTLAFLVGMLAWTGTASAHNVSNINVDCTHVTVHFNKFPEAGVMVHIVAEVEGHAAISTDVLVKNDMTADLSISDATGLLFGASADVDVDVTWNLHGAQHAHEKLTVTCGSSTTTTTKQATTTTVAGGGTTTTTSGGGGTTTTTVASGGTTTTVAGSGGGSTTTTVAGSVDVDNDDDTDTTGDTDVSGGGTVTGTVNTGNDVAVLGETATAGSSALPRTGSTTGPMLAFAAIALVCGLGGVIGARRQVVS